LLMTVDIGFCLPAMKNASGQPIKYLQV